MSYNRLSNHSTNFYPTDINTMKSLVIIANGLTDEPIVHKDNQTILQLAETPHLDQLARIGRTGSVRTIPESLHAGNDVSFLSLL